MLPDQPPHNAITRFTGGFFFLSNFYQAQVSLDGVEYSSVEHAYQAAKSLDPAAREAVRRCETPAEAKALGSRLDLRPDWEAIKFEVMEALMWQKFSLPDLRRQLLETGDAALIEGNNWGDRIWGCTLSDGGEWVGENRLGRLLMAVRARLAAADGL